MKDITDPLSARSGIASIVDENIKTKLDIYGQYSYWVEDDYTPKKPQLLSHTDSIKGKHPSEQTINRKLYRSAKNKYDKLLGYHSGLYHGHVKEGDYRINGTSGGFATWTLVQLLKSKKIDGVLCATQASDGDGILFKYRVLHTIKDIQNASKTKYYPMELSGVLKYIQEHDGKYAIVGIPSFIYEIRLLQEIDPIFAKRIRYTIGLICGHQKSTKYAEAIAWQQGIEPGKLKDITFRVKNENSPPNEYMSMVRGIVDGTEKTLYSHARNNIVSNWPLGFFKIAFSDYIDDVFNSTADITLGDAWLKEYEEDKLGNNIIIVRNPEIQKIINTGIKQKLIAVKAVDAATAIKTQKGNIHHHIDEASYRFRRRKDKSLRLYDKYVTAPSITFLKRSVQKARYNISTKSHIYYAKAVSKNDWSYFEKKIKRQALKYQLIYLVIDSKKDGIRTTFQKISNRLFHKKPNQDR